MEVYGSGGDKEGPKGGMADKALLEHKHGQPIWQVYSRRIKGTLGEGQEGQARNERDRAGC